MALLKVKDNIHLVRDSETGALINKDHGALQEYIAKRKFLESQKHELNKVKSDIEDLKDDLGEIKALMYKLLDKNSHG